jgi:hypothetical protein
MAKMGVGVATSLLIVVISFSAPSPGFALRLGPFHLGLLSVGHSPAHRHRTAPQRDDRARDDRTGVAVYDTTENPGAIGKGPSQAATGPAATGPASALLNPILALPPIYDAVFWPASAWPLGYGDILQVAFGKAAGGRDQRACQGDRGSAVVKRIGSVIRPSETQRPLLQRLGGALAMASGFLARFCPNETPSKPVARLQLVETQLEALTTALDIVRRPLQDLERSLNRNQQTRLAAALAMPSAASADVAAPAAAVCDPMSTTLERTTDELNQTVQPNSDAQRTAMAATKQAFGTAARDLDAQCPMSLPTAPSERLKAMQARLDAEWRAALVIRVAMENLESTLSEEQRARVNALDFASRGPDNVFGRN